MTNSQPHPIVRRRRAVAPAIAFLALLVVAWQPPLARASEPDEPLDIGRVEFLPFAPWSRVDFYGDDDDIARLVQRQADFLTLETGQALRLPLPEDSPPGPAMAVSPDGKQIAISGGREILFLDAVKKRKTDKVLAGHRSELKSMAYSPDGGWLATIGTIDKFQEPVGVLLWDIKRGKQFAELYFQGKSRIDAVAFSPDGTWLAGVGEGSTQGQWQAAIWRTSDGEKAASLPLGGIPAATVRVKFSPKGEFVAIEHRGRDSSDEHSWVAARVFQLEIDGDKELTAKEILAVPHVHDRGAADSGRLEPKGAVAFDPSETRIAVAAGGNTAAIRALPDFAELHTLTGHEAPITWVEFSPDGKQVLTASVDWTVKIWDAESGELIDSLRSHRDAVLALRFSRDGKRLLSIGEDSAKVWDYAGRVGVDTPDELTSSPAALIVRIISRVARDKFSRVRSRSSRAAPRAGAHRALTRISPIFRTTPRRPSSSGPILPRAQETGVYLPRDPPMNGRNRPRAGFTLVELLVVISIIGLLMALLFPALNAARESARANTCRNNIKNIATAISIYEQRLNAYPSLFGNKFMKNDASGTFVERPLPYVILPFLDRNDIYKEYEVNKVVLNPATKNKLGDHYLEIFVCPSDPQSLPAPTSYVYNVGNRTLYTSNGVFFEFLPGASTSYIGNNDGLGATLMLSENLDAGSWNSWWVPDGGGGFNLPAYEVEFMWHDIAAADWPTHQINYAAGASPGQVAVNYDFARPSSNHGGGVNAAFCDTHVRFIREDIDYRVYAQLMTPNGREAVTAHPDIDLKFLLDENDY